ncbi:hypothetical protein ZOSMA_174G00210 [Zostera marina]|uniref:Uncharacterized protein n=1 Tax=Zostera marina TaxID=29655 RepID=A0A0K9PS68_ZOSMR|nr:hypothetical protein ZOSMA_174G00210 [Zostera marina]
MFETKNNMLAVQTLRTNLAASTIMASTSITLSSIIVVLMNNGIISNDGAGSGESSNPLLYGNSGEVVQTVKFFLIIVCFLTAFLCYMESIRYYNHVSFLINVPLDELPSMMPRNHEYVARWFNWGSNFWSLGLRAFYFSFSLFL